MAALPHKGNGVTATAPIEIGGGGKNQLQKQRCATERRVGRYEGNGETNVKAAGLAQKAARPDCNASGKGRRYEGNGKTEDQIRRPKSAIKIAATKARSLRFFEPAVT